MEYSLKLVGKPLEGNGTPYRGSLENLRPSPESFENPPSPSCRRVEHITGQQTFDCRLLLNLEFLVKANHMFSAPSGPLRAPLQRPQRPLEPSACAKANFSGAPVSGYNTKYTFWPTLQRPQWPFEPPACTKACFSKGPGVRLQYKLGM